MVSLQVLYDEWAAHPLGKNRATGGRIALGGFLYQLYLSLDGFFVQIMEGNREAQFLFDGLTDIAQLKGEVIYLTQVKTTLDQRSLRATVDEALAVWQFLEEKHSDLQDRVRFQIIARNTNRSSVIDLRKLDAEELALDLQHQSQWLDIRKQFLPIQVRANPKIDLAIRLWPHAKQCFELVDRCIGRLFAQLGEKRSSTEIAEALLEIWDRFRVERRPPGVLLGPQELGSDGRTHSTRIVHGVQPRLQDLYDGCFMERPAIIEKALSTIRETIRDQALLFPRQIPIFWIVGPSGAGKSALLLQVMQELVLKGDAEVANYVAGFVDTLPHALAYWSATSERVVIAVDDLYAPESREPAFWRNVAELSFTTTWHVVPWILTCGPSEQLRAFKHEAHRYAEFQPFEIRLEPMNTADQAAYHSWYVQRTASQIPLIKEPIIVAAAWMYELRRQADLSPEAFADRFYTRLGELGLKAAARTALLLNQYGINAPEKLFAGHEGNLDQLISEQIYRLASPGAGVRQGRFFHPRISKIIYDSIVPEVELRHRAEDLARGFGAMINEDEKADSFLTWLNATKTQSLVSSPLKKEVLTAMWSVFRECGPSDQVMPRLRRWHEMARAVSLNLQTIGAGGLLRDWFHATAEDKSSWGILFQVVWDEASATQRDALFLKGVKWLQGHFESPFWSWIWRRLWSEDAKNQELLNLGFLWLYDRPADTGWSWVWQSIFDSGLRDTDLLKSALEALSFQPASPADIPIWLKVERLNPDKIDFLSAILHKLARIGNPYYRERGTKFVLERLHEDPILEALLPAIKDSLPEAGWSYLWRGLVEGLPEETHLIQLGGDWLTGREDKPEWSHVWRRLVELDFKTDELLPVGRDWLTDREDRPEWSHVWQRLVKLDFETDKLLPVGRDWLIDREDKPEWSHVWQRLVELDFETDKVLPVGHDWLTDREDKPEWAHVWQNLVELDFETDKLLPVGRDWLTDREDKPEWNYVWQRLVELDFETDKLLPVGRDWLMGREDKPAWSHVWRRLVKLDFETDKLLPVGRDWLMGREDKPEWSHVWRRLVKLDFETDKLLSVGRDWLNGRDDREGYPFMYRRIHGRWPHPRL